MTKLEDNIDCIPDFDGSIHFESSSTHSLSSCLKKQDTICEDSLQSPDHHVSFDMIEILEFPLEIGDNPSVFDGPPVQIGWTPENSKVLRLDIYEVFRPKRRNRFEMFMTTDERTESLLHRGYTDDEIRQAASESARIQEQRFQSARKRGR
ncbi:unnamed protein product [Cylindrotheca closterium]|uniref:Uncharacterized protein n=1 Tax=Cylindrotheca closterium TaxID=2856 RepID=A0AAD2GC20_9STRA|nr:unnamed protein product [Cylindrotheca closterium]